MDRNVKIPLLNVVTALTRLVAEVDENADVLTVLARCRRHLDDVEMAVATRQSS